MEMMQKTSVMKGSARDTVTVTTPYEGGGGDGGGDEEWSSSRLWHYAQRGGRSSASDPFPESFHRGRGYS